MNKPQDMKKLFIKTYGCQMNVYDSDRMVDALAPEGYEATTNIDDADLVVLNTCHIREKAAEKVYSELGRLRIMRQKKEQAGGEMMIGIAGCVAQAEGEEIVRRAPVVDLVFGPQSYHISCLNSSKRRSAAKWWKQTSPQKTSLNIYRSPKKKQPLRGASLRF